MRAFVALTLLVAATGSAFAQDDPVRGRLCIREPGALAVVEKCAAVEGTRFDVEPDPERRVWIWYRGDQRALVLGLLEANASVLDLPEDPRSMTIEVTGAFEREWPQATTITIGPSEITPFWTIVLSPTFIGRLGEISLPRGRWSIDVNAERHFPETLFPVDLREDSVELEPFELEPLPQIRATVIDREGELLPAVMMIAEDGTPLTSSDGEGEIQWESSCGEDRESCLLPEWFRLESPGTAPRWFHVVRRDLSVDLDVVSMAPGGTLDLRVDRSMVEGPLVVEIVEDAKPFPRKKGYPVVVRTDLEEDEDFLIFEDLPEGMLRLDISSPAKGTRYSEYIVVRAEQALEHDVVIRPKTVVFELRRDGKSIGGVPLRIEQDDPPHHLIQTMPSDESGRTSAVLWQPGRYVAHIAHRRIRGGVRFDTDWVEGTVRIEVGSAEASGTVVDDETGEPVAGALVVPANEVYSEELTGAVATDEYGSWKLDGLITGRHGFRASADGYVDGFEGLRIEAGVNVVRPIRMKRGTTYTIMARWEDGTPIEGAAFLFVGEPVADPKNVTDALGRIQSKRVPPPRPVPFFIVPREGSFASGELYLDPEIEVIVPPPSGRVVLDLKGPDGKPTDFAQVLFSYNRFHVSHGLWQTIEEVQGQSFRSGPSSRVVLEGLAPGTYGFSAVHVFSESEVPEYPRPGKVTYVHAGPVEQSDTVTVREVEEICRGRICQRW